MTDFLPKQVAHAVEELKKMSEQEQDKLKKLDIDYVITVLTGQAYGSALTYSERYFLLKFFGIPTDEDDADARDTKGKQRANSYNNNNNQNKQQQSNGQANKASEKQLKMIHAKIAHISVLAKADKQTIEDTLKGNIGTENLSEISSQVASKAIEVLMGWEKQYSQAG
ncbi:ERF family protein [Bacillus thuringiensis]|uniref:ERF family protein n=1 Tax=Bacillus thuringiensis TaxID=1428 RepID=UPI002E19E0E1|nr:ERF family protein [Bacillus thuringiensis]